MTREETLEWIDIAFGAMDRHDLMALINESFGEFDGEFFSTVDGEIERYKTSGDSSKVDQLTEVARAVAALRQNRTEKL